MGDYTAKVEAELDASRELLSHLQQSVVLAQELQLEETGIILSSIAATMQGQIQILKQILGED